MERNPSEPKNMAYSYSYEARPIPRRGEIKAMIFKKIANAVAAMMGGGGGGGGDGGSGSDSGSGAGGSSGAVTPPPGIVGDHGDACED